MRCPRVYIDTPLSIGIDFSLPQHVTRHLVTVLRRKRGQTIHVFNGTGGCYLAEIVSQDKRSAIIKIIEFLDEECESPLKITLAQGISRGQHMDYTIQKSVELGVQRIVPILTEYGNVHLDEQRKQKRLEHWNKIIISACEQCGRNRLPELLNPVTISEWLSIDQSSVKLILEPTATENLKSSSAPEQSISVLLGPEGGFSDFEIEAAVAHGFRTVKFGPRVLRTETAAGAILTAIQTLWGDMG